MHNAWMENCKLWLELTSGPSARTTCLRRLFLALRIGTSRSPDGDLVTNDIAFEAGIAAEPIALFRLRQKLELDLRSIVLRAMHRTLPLKAVRVLCAREN